MPQCELCDYGLDREFEHDDDEPVEELLEIDATPFVKLHLALAARVIFLGCQDGGWTHHVDSDADWSTLVAGFSYHNALMHYRFCRLYLFI